MSESEEWKRELQQTGEASPASGSGQRWREDAISARDANTCSREYSPTVVLSLDWASANGLGLLRDSDATHQILEARIRV